MFTEGREQSGNFGRHVLGQFQRVAFRAPHHTVLAKYGGRYMEHLHELIMYGRYAIGSGHPAAISGSAVRVFTPERYRSASRLEPP